MFYCEVGCREVDSALQVESSTFGEDLKDKK